MEVALATVFVSPIVKELITKLLTYASDQIAVVWGVKVEIEKLVETLELIEAVLHDAENRQVQSKSVNLWLEKLKDVVYDAEDVLAELEHRELRRKMNKRTVGIGFKIGQKIQAVDKKLDDITKNMERFKFIISSGSKTITNENRSETVSHINDSGAVLGRKDDVSEILNLLIDSQPNYNQESYSVVRITGMGGIGKSTLAQLVFKELSDHFKVLKWVSVSRKSDVKEIFGDLLESNEERNSNLETIKNRLKKTLKKGKCLIILDDVWINNGIDVEELLKDLLSMSCIGSKILMTMRNAEPIPPMTGCRYKIYQLHVLPDDDCWTMIKKTAFGHGGAKETPDLIKIGRKIASKCGGLPLAAKTLGNLLYSRDSEEEWSEILNSEIWNLPTNENKIISILKLSYDELPPYVKRCFSYCSIFPKGHTFLKKELILMWMAEGFLNSRRQPKASVEIVGKECFKILLFNSFFQEERRYIRSLDLNSCRMHDLVHDLAISVAGRDSRMVKENDLDVIKHSNKFRRLGLDIRNDDCSAVPSEIKASKLHTLVFCSSYSGFDGAAWANQIFSFSLLRVLNLSWAGIEELPESISELKYLRYLDLSHTLIQTFPSSFSQLYNLQTLRVKKCELQELPDDMTKLIGLEYFSYSPVYRDRLGLAKMPKEVRRFTKLQKLSIFVVGVGKGYGIEELKDLNLLGGKLDIANLEKVTDAKQANLMGKKNITHLNLAWDFEEIANPNPRLTEDNLVLNDLQPHRNLIKLEIHCFCGSEFPPWMNTSISIHLPNLVRIRLWNCVNCQHLPALGQLQSLRDLDIHDMEAIKQIGDEFYQSNGEASFPSLVEFNLSSLPNLEEWLEDQGSTSTSSFSRLERLRISECFKLSTTPTKFPSLKNLDYKILLENDYECEFLPQKMFLGANLLQALVIKNCDYFVGFLPDDEQHYQPDDLSNNVLSKIEIRDCPSLTEFPTDFRGLNSLTYLAIEECGGLESLPDGIQFLPALQTLILGPFSEDLESFPFPAATGSEGTNGEPYFVALRELTIRGWTCLEDVLPSQIQYITSLQRLKIDWYDLVSLPDWFGELSSLQTLDIEHCWELKHLPSEEQMLRLTSLQTLTILDCPLLQERCRFGNEESLKLADFNLTEDSDTGGTWKRARTSNNTEELALPLVIYQERPPIAYQEPPPMAYQEEPYFISTVSRILAPVLVILFYVYFNF